MAAATRNILTYAAAGIGLTMAALLLLEWSYGAELSRLGVRRPGGSSPAPDMACLTGEGDDPPDGGLEDASELLPGEEAIFFLETSCRVEEGSGLRLTWRQACAVESTARAHPHRAVFLLVTAPAARNTSSWSAPARQLLHYSNVRVVRIRGTRYTRDTPLAAWWEDGAKLSASHWPVEHTSDALRFLTLWRFGGLYLDLDFVVLRSLNTLRNFACAESREHVNGAAISFRRDAIGRRMAWACLRDLLENYKPNVWGNNGPELITRVLKEMCDTKKVVDMTAERCGGFSVLPPEAFYPIRSSAWRRFFEEEDAESTMEALSGSYAVHLWHHKSSRAKVALDSRQPYGQLARRFCPRVATAAGTLF